MEKFFNKIKIYQNSFIYLIFFISLLKIILYYFIPINILGNAPHDDYLFYRLGKSISEYNWLGQYDQLTLIKGPIYPLFISVSIYFHIPLRILEALFSILASLYFLNSTRFLFKSINIRLIIFILISFFPFIFTALEYRVLRDSVYIYLLLFILSDIFFILTNHKLPKIFLSRRFFSLGFFLSLFFLTREEGIWIIPGLLIFILCFSLLARISSKEFIIYFLSLLLSFYLTNIIFKSLNKIYYDSYILNTFKDENFDYGYSALFRIKHNSSIKRISIPSNTWNEIFELSPTAKTLSNYINGPAYKNWVLTACDAIRNQHPDEPNPHCENGMLVGYLMMAFIDALYDAGYTTPTLVSNTMKKIGDEISSECHKDLNLCIDAPFKMMPPSTFKFITFLETLRNIPDAFNILINSHNNDILKIKGSGNDNLITSIAKDIGAFIFNYKNIKNNINYDYFNDKTISNNIYNASVKIIVSSNNKLIVEGVNNSIYQKVITFINDKYFCESITIDSKFICSFENNFQFPIRLNTFLVDSKNLYKINIDDSILKNISFFDEDCYLKNNNDVMEAVNLNLFSSGYEHWKYHGINESRLCSPNDFFSFKQDSKFNHNKINDIAIGFIQSMYQLYKIILYIGIVSLFLSILIILKNKNYIYLSIYSVLTSLVLSRVILISLLDETGLAPITGMYLLSGTFSFFVLILLSFTFLFSYLKHQK